MSLKLTVTVGGEIRQIETAATALSDLTLPLKLWAKYKRQEVQRRFDEGGPGWPGKKSAQGSPPEPKAEEARLKGAADNILRIKLRAELRRAQRKYVRKGGSAETMRRRYAVLKEFERIAAGGTGAPTLEDARLAKSVRGLRARHQRAAVKAAGRPLGRMAQSIKAKVEKYSVEVYSTVPWAGVHNDGGTAGHGAKIPERKFLEVSEGDVAILQMLVQMHVTSRG